MHWSGVNQCRTTAISRNRAKHLFEKGLALHCVWSGRKLNIDKFDIDHCFPYSAWPCDDLWNLMPSSRRVNQINKRDKLSGLLTLNESRKRIMEWWNRAYIEETGTRQLFFNEARASLRLDFGLTQHLDENYDSAALQQTQFKFNQRILEWNCSQ